MKTKIILASVAAVLIIGIAVGAFLWMRRPQVITFSDDSKVTLLSVEYGKRHAPPNVKAPAKPATGAAARRGGGGSFTTPTDTLVLWVRQEYDSKQWHNFQYYAYDKADTACVQTYGRNYGNGRTQGNEVVAVQLDAFPRRQGKFIVRVQEQGNGDNEMAEKNFVISNPAGKSFPTWTAESLPVTKNDDDLSVTLTKLAFGADTTYNRNQDNPEDPANKGVQMTYHVTRNGNPVANWQPVSIETSDSTGNHVGGGPSTQWNGDEGVTTYQWGLWSDEPAWKVRTEFSQQSDFSDAELWAVQDIPLQPGRQQDFWNYNGRSNTNTVFAETDLNGFHLKIFPAKQFTDMNMGNGQMGGGLQIQVNPSPPNGMRMTLVKVTDNQGQEVQYYNSGWGGGGPGGTQYRFQLRDIGGLTNLNLTIALHKSRFVEFTAKPTKEAVAAPQ